MIATAASRAIAHTGWRKAVRSETFILFLVSASWAIYNSAMCGRYTLTSAVEALRQLFDFAGAAPNLEPRYNIAPTQRAPVIRLGADGGREMQMLSWGLVPYWAEDISMQSHMINARGETVAEKPAFRQAFRQRRCLVPADGFYEWPTVGAKSKQPFLFRRQDKVPFAFAGLWERWVPPQGEVLETFTIVNIAANATMAPFHDRIPVILDPLDYAAWLDPKIDAIGTGCGGVRGLACMAGGTQSARAAADGAAGKLCAGGCACRVEAVVRRQVRNRHEPGRREARLSQLRDSTRDRTSRA